MRSVARPLKTLVSRWKGRNGLALSLLAPALGVALMLPAGAAPKTSPPSVQPPSVVAATNWDVEPGPGGTTVTWHSATLLPMGAAVPEFRVGDRVIGYPNLSPDLRSLSLTLPDADLPDLSDLQVWLSGRRLDAPMPASASRNTPYAPQDTVRTLAVDPGMRGPWATTTSDYTLDPVRVPDLPLPVEMVGHVVAPTDAPGARPLVLLLHGRHQTCYRPGTDQGYGEWPCPSGFEPVPSHLGYEYLQQLLASQGYVTVSIAANGVNGQEILHTPDVGTSARAALVRRHVQTWARWAAVGAASPWAGRVDMDQVTLVGHSRGGEAVNRAAIGVPAAAPYAINGVVLIAPTAVGRQAAPGTPTVTLLGYCDGDLTHLPGQQYADVGRDLARDSALRSTVLLMGANHNYFNTQWTPGSSVAFAVDDWPEESDPVCGTGSTTRLSAAGQRAAATAYVAGAVRLFARRDDRVLPMFDGSSVRVPSAGEVDIRSTAVGARRRMVSVRPDLTVTTTGALEARICRGYSSGSDEACGAGVVRERTPHWPAEDQSPYPPGQPALHVSWTGRGAATLQLEHPLDLSASTSVDARVIVSTATPDVRLGLRLEDAEGGTAVLEPRAGGRLHALPGGPKRGSPLLGKLLAQTLRTPLAEASGIDLTRITGIGLTSRSERGRIWLLDVAARRPGLAPARAASVPLVRLLDVNEPEGSATDPQHVTVTVGIRGELTEPTRVAVRAVDPEQDALLLRTSVRLRPGDSTATFTVPYSRDDLDEFPDTETFDVFAFAPTAAVMTSDFAARVTIRDDDPSPRVRIRPANETVDEGSDLRWVIGLSEPVSYFVNIDWRVVAAGNDVRQLSSNDVPASWLRSRDIEPPQRPVALWRLDGLQGSVSIDAGRRRAVVAIPTDADGRVEEREALALELRVDPLANRPVQRVAWVADVRR